MNESNGPRGRKLKKGISDEKTTPPTKETISFLSILSNVKNSAAAREPGRTRHRSWTYSQTTHISQTTRNTAVLSLHVIRPSDGGATL